MAEPAYKASLAKSALKSLEKHTQGFEQILERVDPAHVEAIQSTSRLSWLPAADFDNLNLATLEVLGESGYLEFWRVHTKALTEMPLFGALARGAMNMFGIGPASLIRFLDKAWLRATRDYGRVEVSIEPEAGRAELSQLELPECGHIRTVGLSMKGSLTAFLEMGRATGEVALDESRINEGRFDFVVTWNVG